MPETTPVHLPAGRELPEGLLDAFWSYETALMANDLEALDRLFAPGPDTLRGDAAGLLVGHEAISRFRGKRGGSPKRSIAAVHVRPIDDDNALVIAVTAPAAGGRGQQTQLWRRGETGWVVDAAHVSLPAPAVDARVWRVAGAPLVPSPVVGGALAGHRVAVKDLFDVAGFTVGAGVPEFLAEGSPAPSHAPAVAALLGAGAALAGIAQTDEFAYSIAGRNVHYGTPPNPRVPGGIPGGSTSGPASAVASGAATIGLGTDTGGSIRVPASYQGLWGLRTTHGAVSVEGLLPLAPSFDTVGWLTRDAATLRAAAAASLDADAQHPVAARYVVDPALIAQAQPEERAAIEAAIERLVVSGAIQAPAVMALPDAADLFHAFRMLQASEAWRSHSAWVQAHPGVLGDDIAERFAFASTVTLEQRDEAAAAVAALRKRILAALDGRILLLPSASSTAPSANAEGAEIEAARVGTLRMTAVAGIAGLPALSVPAIKVNGAPLGLCLVGPRHGDLGLIDEGARLAAAL